ncbi:hypothetical protein ED5_2881 [Enterobacter roggenkampii]|nr:hypothetical protein ED5_2881 [Enterobacter roggenkampii]
MSLPGLIAKKCDRTQNFSEAGAQICDAAVLFIRSDPHDRLP